MSLTARTTAGILWNLSEQFAKRGISIVVTLLLAKFLAPEDFGLVAMMAVFLALGQSLMDSGFREALIRIETVSQADFATAFYANLTLGLVSYAILFTLSPAIAEFYAEPRLENLIKVASLLIIIRSFQVVQIASLSRKLQFKNQLKASFPAGLMSGACAILFAYLGMGVWALVLQMLINGLIHTLLLYFIERWTPTLEFNKTSAREMYRFGYKLFLSGALDTIFRNMYVMVIAKIFSTNIAGLYFFSQKIRELAVQQLVTSIERVTYPALTTLQADNERLKAGYRKVLVLMSAFLFPGILYIAVVAEPLFTLFFPERWLPALPFFQLLCLATILLPLHSVNLNILKVKGRSDLFLLLEVVKKSINVLMLLATYQYGVYAIIYGQIATSAISYVPNSYYSKKLLNYGVLQQLRDFMPILITSVVSAVFAKLVIDFTEFQPVVDVALITVLMVLSFISLSFIFNKQDFDLIIGYLYRELPFKLPKKG